MIDVQGQITLLQDEIREANAGVSEAVRKRRIAGKESPLVADLDADIVNARKAVTGLELKLRALYESREE